MARNTLDEINGILDVAKEKISDLEGQATKNIQSEKKTQKKITFLKKSMFQP